MKVSVIIVSYNSRDLLRQCIRSIYSNTKADCEIIVADNASSDGSLLMLGSEFPGVRTVRCSENMGFSRANNLGARSAAGDYLLFVNADTVFIEDSISMLARQLDSNEKVGAIGPKLSFEDGSYQLSSGHLPNLAVESADKIKYMLAERFRRFAAPILASVNNSRKSVGWLTGACLMVRSGVFRAVGEFDEGFFMYYEDKDLCKRIGASGWDILYYPETTVVHFLAGSSRSVEAGRIQAVYRASQQYYYRKHLGTFQAVLLRAYLRLTGKV